MHCLARLCIAPSNLRIHLPLVSAIGRFMMICNKSPVYSLRLTLEHLLAVIVKLLRRNVVVRCRALLQAERRRRSHIPSMVQRQNAVRLLSLQVAAVFRGRKLHERASVKTLSESGSCRLYLSVLIFPSVVIIVAHLADRFVELSQMNIFVVVELVDRVGRTTVHVCQAVKAILRGQLLVGSSR